MILEAVNKFKNEEDDNSSFENSSSSNSSDEYSELDNELKLIAKRHTACTFKMSTAFRVMILDKANPVALVGLHEEQN